jgi:isopenicillin-N epimerase
MGNRAQTVTAAGDGQAQSAHELAAPHLGLNQRVGSQPAHRLDVRLELLGDVRQCVADSISHGAQGRQDSLRGVGLLAHVHTISGQPGARQWRQVTGAPAGRRYGHLMVFADLRLPDASAWAIDPDLAYLNHGGFGATPVAVLQAQRDWRTAMERNPVGFLVRELPDQLESVRSRVAAFLGADPDGVVFVDNATTGTQTVISQILLAGGDEVLTTDHCYPAALAQLRRAVAAAGAHLRIAPVPLPAQSSASVADAVLSGLSVRTRLVVIDHVASCSGLVFPVEQIVAQCHGQGVPVLVDGAHAPGMLPVDLASLGADFWVGNMHKWVCAPKASAVLHAAPQWRDELRPLVASHGLALGYQPAFDWTGTRDPTAILAVPAALDFFNQAGWPGVRQRNNDLARRGADLVARRVGTSYPHVDGLAAAMRLVPLPAPLTEAEARALEARLLDEHGVVVPVTSHGGWRWLRLSAQLYNTLEDYERLADALISAWQA